MAILIFIQFVQPLLLAAAAGAVVIPLVIHLINRRRYKRVPWAAMSFLLAAAKRSAKRIQLEQWSLLLLRMLLILILGLLLARPYFRHEALAVIQGSRAHHVLVIDTSASMTAHPTTSRAVASTVTQFERARTIALDLVRSFPEQDSVSIIVSARPAAMLVGYECFDHRLVQDELQVLKPTYRSDDLAEALLLAERLVDESSSAPGNRIVYMISDHALHAWQDEEVANASPDATDDQPLTGNRIDSAGSNASSNGALNPNNLTVTTARRLSRKGRLLMVRSSPPPASGVPAGPLSITALYPRSSLAGVNLPLRFDAQITNYAGTSTAETTIQVKRDEQVLREITAEPLGAGETAISSLSLAIAQPGSHGLELRLSGSHELLPEAAIRRLSLDVPEKIDVLLVDGKPSSTPFAGHLGYVAAALSAYTANENSPLFDAKLVSDLELGVEVFDRYSLLVLGGVSRISEALGARLTDYVTQGGSILIFMGEGVFLEDYNRWLFNDGRSFLPGKLEQIIGDEAPDSPGWRLQRQVAAHPLTAEFVNLDQSGLFQARFRKYVKIIPFDGTTAPDSAPTPTLAGERIYPGEVVLALENQDPGLLMRRFGRGQAALFASTANMEWCNLPAKGDFVSLMANLAADLCSPLGTGRTLEAGTVLRQRLNPAQAGAGVELFSPSQQKVEVQVDCENEQCELISDHLDEPGFYRLRLGADTQIIAVNFPAGEADLTPLTANEAKGILGDEAEWVDDAGDLLSRVARGRTTEIGGSLIFALLGLLLVESWLAMRFGIHR